MLTGDDSSSIAVVRIHRRRVLWRNRLAKYQVLIDDESVGSIAQGETADFSVSPGDHRVVLTISRVFTSPVKLVSLRAGQLAEFTCGPGGPAIEGAFSLLRPHRYISLDGPVQWPSPDYSSGHG